MQNPTVARAPVLKPVPRITWLPAARQTLLLSRPLSSSTLQSFKTHDWFFCLASAMITEADSTQGKFLAKLYCLFVDFIPQGLAGNFSHINGKDIMDHLLCSPGETAPSRHKFSKDTEAAWCELECWMKNGQDWRGAAAKAKSDYHKHGATNGPYKRKVASWKAPGLVSPAGILALLAISYPDKLLKISKRIDELQLTWMMEPRETLNIQEGFWKGINGGNVDSCFLQEDGRGSELEMKADYSLLFGKDFPKCQQDLTPHLPRWAQSLTLRRPPSLLADVTFSMDSVTEIPDGGYGSWDTTADEGHNEGQNDDSGEDEDKGNSHGNAHCTPGSAQTNGQPDQVSCDALRHYFEPVNETPEQSKAWLLPRLLVEKGLLWRWCRHWANRLANAHTLQQQLIIRSLFLSSVRRLHTFYEAAKMAKFATPEAYMLLDIEDTVSKTESTSNSTRASRTEKILVFKAYMGTANELSRLMIGHELASTFIKAYVAHKASWFLAALKDADPQYALDMISLDELRIRFLLGKIRERDPDHSVQWDDNVPGSETIEALQLTAWQQQMVFVHGSDIPTGILTDDQVTAQQTCKSPDSALYSNHAPVAPEGAAADTDEIHPVLSMLFGDIPLPPALNQSPLLHQAARSPVFFQAAPPPSPGPAEITTCPGTPIAASQMDTRARSMSVQRISTPVSQMSPPVAAEKVGVSGFFSGMKCSPVTKRKSSLADVGPLKRLRIDNMSKYDLAEELRHTSNALRTDLNTDRQAYEVRLTERVARISEDVNQRSQKLEDLITKKVASADADNKRAIQELRSGLSSILETTTNQLADMTAQLSNIKQMQVNTHDQLEALKSSMAKVPELGDAGYIALHCPAPLGWDDANKYSCYLYRAAIFYISTLGLPAEGVTADEEAFRETMDEFPEISEAHLVDALQHVHQAMYNRPFNRTAGTE